MNQVYFSSLGSCNVTSVGAGQGKGATAGVMNDRDGDKCKAGGYAKKTKLFTG